MKIAIQGHPTRGKEVIQIFESLGGKNINGLTGNDITFYYINNKNEISSDHKDNFPLIYNFYTLEIFEKEFPFKIGDKVIHEEYDSPFEIIQFDPENVYPYAIDGVCEFRTKSCTLTKYQPKMKEERNITLTLDKAKEWYKKGGDLKQVALQAFSEKELNPLPRSWEEYNRRYVSCCFSTRYTNIPLKYDALLKLEQLRDCWRQGWKPDWRDVQTKYCIKYCHGKVKIIIIWETSCFLSFPTKEIAEEFLEYFRDLIEKARDLI